MARTAEKNRPRELEEGFNNFADRRQERIRSFAEIADQYFDAYKLRLPDSARFAEYAIDHLMRHLGTKMLVDFNEAAVIQYQNAPLAEGAAPKSINEEMGFLLRILGDHGDLIRIRLRKRKMLKLKIRQTVGRAYTQAEKDRMLLEARKARSPHIFPALSLALNAGMRDAEIKNLTWGQIDFTKKFLAVGRSKTDAGEGRTIPLNSTLLAVFSEYGEWYREKFGKLTAEWYVFPFGKPTPCDPTRAVTTLKTAWNNVRKNAKVKGRWHDNRHTLITELLKPAPAIRRSWTLPDMSQSRCSSTIATSVWRQNALLWRLLSIGGRSMSALVRKSGMRSPQMSCGMGENIRRARIGKRRSTKRSQQSTMRKIFAQKQSQIRSILIESTHKSPHNRVFSRLMEELRGGVSL